MCDAPAALHAAQTPLRQQRSCPSGHQGAHCQLTPHRQLQPSSPSVSPQDTSSSPPPPPLPKSPSSPGAPPQTSSRAPHPPSLASASSAQTSVPAAKVRPQPPPLTAAPQHRSTLPQVQSRPLPPPPPPLVLPRFPRNPPQAFQRPSAHSVQALAIQPQQVALKEQEPVQAPHRSLSPPQTEAVDLKVQPAPSSHTPPVSRWSLQLTFTRFFLFLFVFEHYFSCFFFKFQFGQTCRETSLSLPEKKDQSPRLSPQSPPPVPGWLKQTGAGEAFLKKKKE